MAKLDRLIFALVALTVLVMLVAVMSMYLYALIWITVALCLWALFTTAPGHRYNRRYFGIQNTGVVSGLALILAIFVLGAGGLTIYELGGCTDGFKSPSICSHILNRIGDLAYGVYFISLLYFMFVAWPALIALALAEGVTRYRAKQAGSAGG